MSGKVLDRLRVPLEADGARFKSELDKSARDSQGWSSQVRGHVGSVGTAFAAGSAAVVASLAAIYTQHAPVIDANAKLADQIRATTVELVGMRHAGELTGVSNAQLDSSIQRMVKRMGEAQQGFGAAKKELDRLGLSNQEFFALSTAEKFSVLADEIKAMSTAEEQAAATSALFGREGLALVNTFNLGSEAIESMQSQVEKVGAALDRVDSAKVEAANDAMARTGLVVTGVGNRITVGLAPYIDDVATRFFGAAQEADGFAEIIGKGADYTIKAIGLTANTVRGLEVVWAGAKAAVASYWEGTARLIAQGDVMLTAFLNKIPGVTAKESEFIQGVADSVSITAATIRKELADLAQEPLPYDGIVQWSEEVQRKSQERAEAVAAESQARIAAGSEGGDFPGAANDEKFQKQLERVEQQLMTEEERLAASYERRQLIIDDAHLKGQISDQRYNELMLKNSSQYFARAEQMEAQKKAAMLTNYSGLFDGLAGIAKAAKGEQSGIYKAMFAASKAFAVAESIIKIQQGIASAAALPFPANIPAMGIVAAQTAGIVSTIQGTEMPSFDGGGFTGYGSRSGGLDGKGGFPAMLHPNETVIDHTKSSEGGGSVVQINFTVHAMDAQSFQGALGENRSVIEGIVVDAHNRLGIRSALG